LASAPASAATSRLIFNNQLDAAVTAGLVVMVALVLIESIRQWLGVLRGQRAIVLRETPFVRTRLAEDRI
jgi:hypothetical protein